MKFTSFIAQGRASWGLIDGERVCPITQWPTLKAAIASNALPNISAAARGAWLELHTVKLLPVIPDPDKIICVGLNYEKHRKETGRAVVQHPTIFTRFADSQVAHGADIVLPPESERLDYEGELAVVIGKGGRRIPASDALQHVAGYSCYNDGSIRDWQAHTIQFGPGKNWPETGAFGPWLVTADLFGELGPQRIQTRLNGVVMQDAHLNDLIFPIPQLIEYISTFTPLRPGDVIVSGTPGGVGHKRDPQVYMRPGDRVEVEIDGIGTLRNGVVRRE
jgi:2-keto-4-pentenoate hydratase/2-oxohepta-3-ene-1,7-dioic acid hydratase in catechol pathway